jgi:hypothetical protein
MTRAAKIVYSGALILGLLAGAFAGFHDECPMLKHFEESTETMMPQSVTDFWYLQYKYADPADAKAALLSSAALLEEMCAANPKAEPKGEVGEIYAHLAMLADAENNPAASREYMIQARSWWANLKDRDISDDELKAAVKKMDDNIPH